LTPPLQNLRFFSLLYFGLGVTFRS